MEIKLQSKTEWFHPNPYIFTVTVVVKLFIYRKVVALHGIHVQTIDMSLIFRSLKPKSCRPVNYESYTFTYYIPSIFTCMPFKTKKLIFRPATNL